MNSEEDLKKALQASQAENEVLNTRVAAMTRELDILSYSISHDLKAPLRAVEGFSKVIQEDYADKLDEEGQRYLQIIVTSCGRLAELIDAVLQYSRIARLELSRENLKMNEMISGILGELKNEIAARKIDLKIGELPDAHGDWALVRQAWVQLIRNSIKYTRNKAEAVVEISGKVNNGLVTYSIRDNGVGFEPKNLQKLFGLFQRFHSEKDFEGIGVGLALTQRIIRRHDGEIVGNAAVDQGATFTFTLPGVK